MEMIAGGETLEMLNNPLSPKQNWFYNEGGKIYLLMDIRCLEGF